MTLVTTGLHSTQLIHPAKSSIPCLQQARRCQAYGRSSKHPQRRLAQVVILAASKEGAGSEQGRLVRDALEFSRPSSGNASQQPTSGPSDSVVDFKPGQLLGGKYTVVETVGRGKAGVTYKAERPGGGLVAIKALSLRTMQGDWKQLELFEKEANALRSMNHSGIPAYKDYFEVDSDGDRGYFLVQELVEGKSLAKMVEAGWKPSQKEVERIADQLLSTLAYLQEQKIVHRDVKPENIILEGGKPGGKVFLVDFGGIQQGNKDVADSEVLDTGTLVGTYGYMAPEQLRGSARPASDLFALGGTLLYLLSGEMPSSFPQRRLQIDFSQVDMSPRLNRLLSGLLQPAWEDRLTATQAKAVLAGTASSRQQQQGQRQQGQRQQQKSWNPFDEGAWEERRRRSRGSSSRSQTNGNVQEQEAASTSGRDEPQGVGLDNVLFALAAAYLLPGPLLPLAAITLPFWLTRKSSKRSRRSRSAPSQDSEATTSGSEDSDWMSGSQQRQQRGFGFSDGPAEDARGESEMTDEEVEALRMRRRQQQMAALQQQQMLFNMMRMMGGGMMGGYRGFGGPFGRRGGFGRGPFMF